MRQLDQALKSGRRPTVAPEVVQLHPGFMVVMRACWSTEPQSRPTFAEVTEQLRRAR